MSVQLKSKQPNKSSEDANKNKSGRRTSRFERCGYHLNHNRQSCPAKDVKCHKCSKQGHFAKWCRLQIPPKNVNKVETVDSSGSDSEVFLGEVTSKEQKP